MRVTIIGAGKMGRGIGTRLVAGGNDVEVIDRDPAEAQKLAEELDGAGSGSASAVGPGAASGEVVVLALYYPGSRDAAQQYGEQLAGKVVVEISVPVDTQTWDRLVTPPGTSAAEEIAALLPKDAHVVKAFNTTFANTLVEGETKGQQLDVLIAGDDEGAKGKVRSLVEAGGLRPIDVGALERARLLEQVGLFHILVQEPLGAGFGSALKVHT